MDLILLCENPVSSDISDIRSNIKYLFTKTARAVGSTSSKNLSIAILRSILRNSSKETESGIMSAISESKLTEEFRERFFARLNSRRLRERFLTILQEYARRSSGLLGGMEFQRAKRVSFTHSSASEAESSILSESFLSSRQYLPHSSATADWSRLKSRSMISVSSKADSASFPALNYLVRICSREVAGILENRGLEC